MCAQQERDETAERGSMEYAATEEIAESQSTSTESDREEVSLPRTTTGVIQIMRSKGREDMASLVEELKDASEKAVRTKILAEELLASLRKLHKKKTGHYAIPDRLRKKIDKA